MAGAPPWPDSSGCFPRRRGPQAETLRELAGHKDAAVAQAASAALHCLPAADAALPLTDVLDRLADQRSQLPSDEDAGRLDAAIVPLTDVSRRLYAGGPYELASEPSPPSPASASRAGQLLQDLKEPQLRREVSALLGKTYLGDATQAVVPWASLLGILYGPCFRPMICLPTAVGDLPAKNVIFLVDTGAPITELSPAAFEALGFGDTTPAAAHVSINGQRAKAQLCDPRGNHPDIPVLGADFLARVRARLTVDYDMHTVALVVPKGTGSQL